MIITDKQTAKKYSVRFSDPDGDVLAHVCAPETRWWPKFRGKRWRLIANIDAYLVRAWARELWREDYGPSYAALKQKPPVEVLKLAAKCIEYATLSNWANTGTSFDE